MHEEELLLGFWNYLMSNGMTKEGFSGKRLIDGYMEKNKISVKSLKLNLEILPEKIQELENKILELKQQQGELSLVAKSNEQAVYNIVESEKEEEKPKFSNKEKREIETRRRLDLDRKHVDNLGKSKEISDEVSHREIALAFLKRSFTGNVAIAKLGGD